MNLNDAIQELEDLGSEQTRKTWCRHGAVEPLFGVKFGDLAKLQKRIKVDHTLASELWQTGNHDARLLACMIADTGAITEKELKAWASEVKDSSTAEALAAFASRTPMAAKIREAWLADPKLQRAGWSLVGHCAKDGASLDEAASLRYLKRIEADIHRAENWTRRTMMYVVIGIGGRNATLRKAAEEAIRRIGPVAFDPGRTACEFPDPLPYLAKIWARKKG
ncbi:MAG: DNA alkylation repair protein [Holophagaceae bacterium]|nr:DNA alkylation repair protein [Holophagaceae bacterium]